jgi:uncharacterized protein
VSEPLPPAAKPRIVALDAVRGFALLGIIAVHMVEQYLGSQPPASQAAVTPAPVDAVAAALVGLLFVGKFFAMFSLLFGISFFIQMDLADGRGQSFGGRFTWRLAILFAIGMVHHLVYRGDILAIYAVLGVVLLLFYHVSDRWLLTTAAATLLGLPRFVLGLWTLASGAQPHLSIADDAALQTYWDTLKTGTPAAIGWLNLTEGIQPKLVFLFGWFGRGYQTLGLFLVGLYIGRHGWHQQIDAMRPSIRRLTWWSLGVCLLVLLVIGVAAGAAYATGVLPSGGADSGQAPPEAPPLWLLVCGLMLYDIFNLGAMGAFAGGFLLLSLRRGPQRLLRWLAPVGRTALTTYVMQSVVGGLVFYAYGLNLLGEIGAAAALGIAALVFAGQIVAANLWLRYFRYGPLEWLWRSATYLQFQPLVRRTVAVLPEPV